MKRWLTPDVVRVLAILLSLLGLKAAHAGGWMPDGVVGAGGERLVTTLANRDLNKEAREALTAGYYEGLINEGSRLSSMNRLVTDTRRPTWEDREQPDRRQTHSFLFYELIPNSDTPDYRDERFRYRLKTNSVGMADREYTVEKPGNTRRIALLGDSITRGQGAPYLGNYESLLEDRLNQSQGPDLRRRFEILNFAVGSYSVMQMMDAAVVKGTPYDPDVYIVALTDLSVYRRWGHHIPLLLNSGIDLKYDYLRDLVRQAGLEPMEPLGAVDAKLSRFRIPTIRWALAEIKAHATAQGAEVVVLLVPTGDDPAILAEEFLGVRRMLAELDLPVVDLLDTFADVDDRARIRVADNDRHPNAEGHRMLAERLYLTITADPRLSQAVLGTDQASTEQTAR